MNGVGFEILARTPVPQLPPSYRYLGEIRYMNIVAFPVTRTLLL